MPTFGWYERFMTEYKALSNAEARAFLRAKDHLVADLTEGKSPRRGLRVRQLATAPGVYELTWAPDGRATFEYGEPVKPGHVHIVWRRIGTHDIFKNP